MTIDYNLSGRITSVSDSDKAASANWLQPPELICQLQVAAQDCDALGHTNNVTYVRWLETLAWQHSAATGLDWPAYQRLNRAMVAHHHDITYLQATKPGDKLWLATWRQSCDGRLRLRRGYQIINSASGAVALRGFTDWICVRIDNGKPAKMPAEFVAAYSPD